MRSIFPGALILLGLVAVAYATIPSANSSLATIMPVLDTASCIEATSTSTTSTGVSSTLDTRFSYDFVAVGANCWGIFESGATATTGHGRYFRDGAVIPGRAGGTSLTTYCDSEAVVSVCQNKSE